jgi:glutaredoxin
MGVTSLTVRICDFSKSRRHALFKLGVRAQETISRRSSHVKQYRQTRQLLCAAQGFQVQAVLG